MAPNSAMSDAPTRRAMVRIMRTAALPNSPVSVRRSDRWPRTLQRSEQNRRRRAGSGPAHWPHRRPLTAPACTVVLTSWPSS
jgi:hypothetical protein